MIKKKNTPEWEERFDLMINKMNIPEWAKTFTDSIKKTVIGQDHVIDSIAPYIRRAVIGATNAERPLGVFFLTGPTGTGKTYFVETLAEVMTGSKKNVLRIDCGEYQLEHEVAKLIGAPPGYLGHKETKPIITQFSIDSISNNCGQSVILFDEIEKASTSMMNILLGVLDRGILKLGDGTTVNFDKSFIFFTSNCGAKEIQKISSKMTFGFNELSYEDTQKDLKNLAYNSLREEFSPEFINRLDEIIVYNSLDKEQCHKIIINNININNYLLQFKFNFLKDIKFSNEAIEHIKEKSFDSAYGARNLKRFLQKNVYQKISDNIFELMCGSNNFEYKTMNFYVDVDDSGSLLISLNKKQKKSRKVLTAK